LGFLQRLRISWLVQQLSQGLSLHWELLLPHRKECNCDFTPLTRPVSKQITQFILFFAKTMSDCYI
jgi:hypothetical protein